MVIKTKIVARKIGFYPFAFKSTPLMTDYVDITYRSRGRLGKLLKVKAKKRVRLPKGAKIQLIENHRPNVGQVYIRYKI